MICPKCGYTKCAEIVLFSSIEPDCMICTIREQFAKSIASSGESFRMPIIGNVNSDEIVLKLADRISSDLFHGYVAWNVTWNKE